MSDAYDWRLFVGLAIVILTVFTAIWVAPQGGAGDERPRVGDHSVRSSTPSTCVGGNASATLSLRVSRTDEAVVVNYTGSILHPAGERVRHVGDPDHGEREYFVHLSSLNYSHADGMRGDWPDCRYRTTVAGERGISTDFERVHLVAEGEVVRSLNVPEESGRNASAP